MNIVIKLNKINGHNAVKLSDDKGKVCLAAVGIAYEQYTGDVDEVRRVQEELGLPREHEDKQRG